jgi:antirestriction protein ArdC
MIGARLGSGHGPGQHGAYMHNWVEVLDDDPKEILRAAGDAERITKFPLMLEKDRPPASGDPAPRRRVAVASPRRRGHGRGGDWSLAQTGS